MAVEDSWLMIAVRDTVAERPGSLKTAEQYSVGVRGSGEVNARCGRCAENLAAKYHLTESLTYRRKCRRNSTDYMRIVLLL